MKAIYKRILGILQLVTMIAIMVGTFILTIIRSMNAGKGIGATIFDAVFMTLCVTALIVLLIFLCWRLFTPEGRKAEKEAQARDYINKLEKKREKEWKRMNRQ